MGLTYFAINNDVIVITIMHSELVKRADSDVTHNNSYLLM